MKLKMADPWNGTCQPIINGQINKFEDDFLNENGLPDSELYLKNLEAKLEKLKQIKKLTKKDLLNSLSETKQSHLERLVDSVSSVTLNDPDLDQPVQSTTLHRLIAPEKQANTISEILELLKYDQLGKIFEELENKSKNINLK